MDERLLELARAWHVSGAAEDGAALLLQQARYGLLSAEQILLAAWLGEPSAVLAAQDPELDPLGPRRIAQEKFDQNPGDALVIDMDPRGSLAKRVDAIKRCPGAYPRACLAALRSISAVAGRVAGPTYGLAIRAVENWIRDPSPERAELVGVIDPGEDRWLALVTGIPKGDRNLREPIQWSTYDHPQGEIGVWNALVAELIPWATAQEARPR